MGRHEESPGMQKQAAATLCNLAADAENQRKIGAQVANAHEYICALPEENVAIGNRKRTHAHTHSLSHGGIEALVAAMDRHEESSGVQEQAAGALRNLAANHPENQRKISAQLANALKVHLSLPGKVYE
jgi:hypothetical protein